MYITDNSLINAKIRSEAAMTDLEFFAVEVGKWLTSDERREAIKGQEYYRGNQDILNRKRMVVGPDEELVEAKYLPNTRIVDNQFGKMVDQKKNYLLGKPVTFKTDDEAYGDKLKEILNRKFMRTLKLAGEDGIINGIAWLYPYIDKDGGLAFCAFPRSEILPFWHDAAHTQLDCAVRLYEIEVYEGKTSKIKTYVELISLEGIKTYCYNSGKLELLSETPYLTETDEKGAVKHYNWDRIPLIPIKFNAKELSLFKRCKQLQDAINLILSNFVNSTEENPHNTVLVLRNHEGTDLNQFRHNLAAYGVIKVNTVEGVPGGVDTLNIEVTPENFKIVHELLKKALIENARGYDAKDERMGGQPNQMNIQSMYSDIDLDANDMETELQAAFEDILWFVNVYLTNSGRGKGNTNVEVIFNRDILINETEAINNCKSSVGLISDETIVSQHPWTTDTKAELKKLEKQNAQQEQGNDSFRAAFEQRLNSNEEQ